MQYHWLGKHEFCSGASFLPRVGGSYEDDGWIISFVHDEKANTSQASFLCCIYINDPIRGTSHRGNKCWNLYVFMLQVHIVDAKRFEDAPVAKITLPRRVPYGFHGTFISKNRIM
jgi:carotenoid cleavage dioxygenase